MRGVACSGPARHEHRRAVVSAAASAAKLRNGAKQLRLQWLEVRATWRDENTRRFEEKYITPLLARARATELTMAQMAAVLQKVRHDCG